MHVQEIQTADYQKRYVVGDESGDLVLVVRYLNYLDTIGRACNTLGSYAQGLPMYLTYLQQQLLDYQQVTLFDPGGFVLWLKNPYWSLKVLPEQPVVEARSNRTINIIITAFSGFYDDLWRQDDLAANLNEKTRTYLPARTRPYKSYLRLVFPQIKRRLPSLWTNSYFAATTGGVTQDSLKSHMEGQKGK
jgi:hypothetical protein